MSGAHLSKDFFELIKNIGECKSKQEEEKIVANEVAALRQRLSESPASIGLKRSKEAIVRVMYVEMLGQSAEFGHIHAVNITQQTNLLCKRVGYLACSLCLHPEHELITLLVNTIRRDLKSSNHLEVCAALIAVSKLVNQEIMPAIIECIVELLDHTHEVVRKKAVMALHRMHIVTPGCLSSMTDKLRRVLCDKDPAVMGASLHVLHVLILEQPAALKDLVPSFVSILKQITEHRLPSSFDYHRMPAPWLQIKLLKILSSLGVADARASEQMYEVLYDVLKRADTGINIGYAVVYECVRTVTTIYPNVQLMETAANHISRFVSSENHNLKYLGIKSLASIVQVNQKYALEHQLVVVDCMEDSDETLKRKTLDLLFKMTNATNVTFVVDKLVHHLRLTSDVHFRTELVERITQLAERYAPENAWFITTMNAVFELGGDVVQPETAHNLLRLIAEGGGEDEDADVELRLHAVSAYYKLLQRPHIPDVLTKVVSWTLGEYGYLSTEFSLEQLLELLCDVIERQFAEADTRCWLMSAITKLVAQLPEVPEHALDVARKFSTSRSINLQQYCAEFLALAQDRAVMAAVLPVDASCDDLEVDPTLSFLDHFVAAAVRAGAARYIPRNQRTDESALATAAMLAHSAAAGSAGAAGSGGGSGGSGGGGALRFEEYTKPKDQMAASAAAALIPTSGLNTSGVARRWGAEGYSESSATGSAPPPAPPPFVSGPAPASAAQRAAGGQQPAGLGVGAPPARPEPAAPPPKPAALAEKERIASALFAGMGQPSVRPGLGVGLGANGSSAHGGGAAAAAAAAAGAAAAAVPSAAPKAVAAKEKKDKLKKGSKSADAGASNGSGSGSGSGGGGGGGGAMVGDLLGDLLDLDLGSPAPSTAPMQPSMCAVSGPGAAAGLDLMSMTMAPQLPLSFPSAAAAPLAPLAPTLPAMLPLALPSFGAGMGGMASLAPSVPLAVAPLQPAQPHPGSGQLQAQAEVASDGCLRLSVSQERLPESVVCHLTYASLTHSPLRNIVLNIEPSAQLRATLWSPAAQGGAEVKGTRLTIPLLHGGQSVSHSISFSCVEIPTPQMRVAGFVSYMEDQLGRLEARTISFHLSLAAEQLLRPRRISTQEFGEMWGSHSNQRKFTVATKTRSTPSAYMQAMEEHLHFSQVQVIGIECIMCAVVIGVGATVLVHAKVGLMNGTAIEVTVRTKDNRLSDGVQRLCTQVLAS